jgi:hypothetical protein
MIIRRHHIGQLLLLCFSVFLAHSLVPHHHHSEVIATHTGDSCPIDHEDHHEPGDHPAHCHAFNELAFNKVDYSGLLKYVKKIREYSGAFTPAPSILSAASAASLTVPIKIPLPEKESGGPVSARAPPTLI